VQLTIDDIDRWAEITRPASEPADGYADRLRTRAEQDPGWLARRFYRAEEGRIVAFAWLAPIGGHLGLFGPYVPAPQAVAEADAGLVDEAVAQARAEGATVQSRVQLERESPALVQALTRTGGARRGERVEFRTLLADLPEEDPGDRRIRWRPGALDARTAAVLAATGSDGPDALDFDADALAHLTAYLSDPVLSADPAATVHVGEVDGRDAALVVAQVARDGWSTCTWLGLIPEVRGRGLGHLVHRHGIAMLRAQGGQLYHGGTSADNASMRACFARQGCVAWRRFAEWAWTAPE
jgi:GNAT superfamily N-acetyltransferase